LVTFADNACYGVRILRDYLAQCDGRLRCALLRYNGVRWNRDAGREYVARVERALE